MTTYKTIAVTIECKTVNAILDFVSSVLCEDNDINEIQMLNYIKSNDKLNNRFITEFVETALHNKIHPLNKLEHYIRLSAKDWNDLFKICNI